MAQIKGNNQNNVLSGTAINDQLYGYAGNDVLNGLAGDDILFGGAGADTLNGGNGNDRYYVDTVKDVINETSASDIDSVSASISWTLGVNLENLILTGINAIDGIGNTLANHITGNSANNILRGGLGNDSLVGGLGDDKLGGGSDNDQIVGGSGNDLLDGGSGNDILNGGLGVDTLKGSLDNDILKLTDFVGDFVDGGEGKDTLQLSLASVIAKGTVQNVEIIRYVGFTTGVDKITLDFGGKAYKDTGVTTINLSGFGLEDKLVIAHHDGALNMDTVHYHTAANRRSQYIHSYSAVRGTTGSGSSGGSTFGGYTIADRVSWKMGATKAKLISSNNSNSASSGGNIQITGLPTGLADSQFVFV